MCNGCMLNAIRKGGTYLRTKDISEVEKSKMKLSFLDNIMHKKSLQKELLI